MKVPKNAVTGSRILQAEAASEELMLLHLALVETGVKDFEVVHTHNLADTLEKLQTEKFDLVLLDAAFSAGHGVDGLKDVRRAAPETAVIFLLDKPDEALTTKALRLGAQDYLLKGEADFNLLARVIRYAIERKRNELERERLIRELQESVNKIKALSGLLPICASCKKIRDDKGYWNQVEKYISRYSSATFTHGYCPECAQKAMAEFEASLARQAKG